MDKYERLNIINLAIKTYGVDQQLNHVNEELAELIVEVAKYKRGFNSREKIIEEMADVLNCFEYLRTILDIKNREINNIRSYKMRRTLRRIEEGKL